MEAQLSSVLAMATSFSGTSTSSSDPRRPPRCAPEGLSDSLARAGERVRGLGGRVPLRLSDLAPRCASEMMAGEALSPKGTS